MKWLIVLALSSLSLLSFKTANNTLGNGQQPSAGIDNKGIIRLAYGDGESIFCKTSKDNGVTFSAPVLVSKVTGMHLGNSRGPQIASSAKYSILTAMDKAGNIHSYRLNHAMNKWEAVKNVNDLDGSAPEGLMALAADRNNHFYAVWQDIRIGKKNNIVFSSYDAVKGWHPNLVVYKSPDGHVCECCKPSISVEKDRVLISFRNWLNGSRDIYYTTSADKGKTFSSAKKSGTGTWQLNGCPMDGGGSFVNDKGVVTAAWRRQNDIFFAVQNASEKKIGSGKSVSMAYVQNNAFVAWQDNGAIKLYNVGTGMLTNIGEGSFPRVYALPNKKALCVWERDKTVQYKVVSIR